MYTTPVAIEKLPFTISHDDKGLLIGSCFATEIGAKMRSAKLPVTINPQGIMFNPASVGRSYKDLTSGRRYTEEDLVNHNGMWHSMHHHGQFSGNTPQQTLSKINNGEPANTFDYIILTLGTAWVYEYRGEIVANCHKIPTSEFTLRRMNVSECVSALEPIAQSGKPVIVTVSPVRHIKDGLAENSLSKATLRLAAAELSERFENAHYFPAFEILTDELRDYRYYADDMLHPSKVAADYIWQRFSETAFNPTTQKLISEITKIKSALNHRPLHPESPEYQKFRASTLSAISKLTAIYPQIDFSEETISF